MSGHYLIVTANVNGKGAKEFLILGGGQFLDRARAALRDRTALILPVPRPESLKWPATALVRGGSITFPADSIRDVRMG
jgi:hypothetical protein